MTCIPTAIAGCAGTATLDWLLPIIGTAVGAVVAVAVALPGYRHDHHRRRFAATAGCLFACWWALLALLVLPTTALGPLAAGLAVGLLGGGILVLVARHELTAASAAWSQVSSFAVQPTRCQVMVIAATSDEQLAQMWQHSHDRVLARYLTLRRALLDELERRNRVAFTTWLAQPESTSLYRYLHARHDYRAG